MKQRYSYQWHVFRVSRIVEGLGTSKSVVIIHLPSRRYALH